MRIAVTGGTGYLGTHIVRALLVGGHRVRLLVPEDECGAPVLDTLSALGPLTLVVGDIRDDAAVDELLDGTDALLHAAGVVSTDDRQAELMWDVNAYATEAILKRAVGRGLDPVVLVSSYAALFTPTGEVIGPDSPTAEGRGTYAKTKAYADRVARVLQAAGAPVVVTYPSSVVGSAFETGPGVTERGWAPILQWAIAPTVAGGMQVVDVRDVAEGHRRLMRPGKGPRRFTFGGQLLTFDEIVDALEAGLDKPIQRVPMWPWVMRAVGVVSDVVGRYAPVSAGFGYEAALLLTSAVPTDDSRTVSELGIRWRCPKAAITASVRQ